MLLLLTLKKVRFVTKTFLKTAFHGLDSDPESEPKLEPEPEPEP